MKAENNGTHPYEPNIRGPQNLFEAYLRQVLEATPEVEVHYGLKFETLKDMGNVVESHLTHDCGSKHMVKSKFVIGCDGGGSRVRRCLGIQSTGGPVYGSPYIAEVSRTLTPTQARCNVPHSF